MACELAGSLLGTAVNFAPIPYLAMSFSILTALHASIQHVRGVRAQMDTLAASVDELFSHLNTKLQGMEHLDGSIENLLHDFNSLLIDISGTAEEYSKHSNLKIFFTGTNAQNLIQQHHRKISEMSVNFRMRLQITMHNDMRKFEESRQADMRKLEEARQTDMRKLDEARQTDLKQLLGAIQDLQKERRFSQAAHEVLKGDFPLTKKDIEDYSSSVHITSDEREIVDKMLGCLNHLSVLAPPQYQESHSTGWPSEQYSSNQPSSYRYSEEPATMSEAESQIPPDRWRYLERRPVHPPVHGTYPPYYPPSTASYAPMFWNAHGNHSQPYHPFGHSDMQMPTPYHYAAATVG